MEEDYIEIGRIKNNQVKKKYNLVTDKVIILKERIKHINERHNFDYDKYGKYMKWMIETPDFILDDIKNKNTILILKEIDELNLQLVLRLQTEDIQGKYNTIITFWHMRKRSYNQIVKKNKIIFKKLDKNE